MAQSFRRIAAASLVVAAGVLTMSAAHADPAEGHASRGALRKLPAPVYEFLSADHKAPFGTVDGTAPEEMEFVFPLVGVWSCHTEVGGYSGWPSTWAFKYGAGGHAIEGLYYQKEEDLPPPLAVLGRDLQSLEHLLYDPTTELWHEITIANVGDSGIGSDVQLYTGSLVDGDLQFPHLDEPVMEAYHSITRESFVWTEYQLVDGQWEPFINTPCERMY